MIQINQGEKVLKVLSGSYPGLKSKGPSNFWAINLQF